MANSEQSKWRELLKPLVTAAAVALTAMAALAVYAAGAQHALITN